MLQEINPWSQWAAPGQPTPSVRWCGLCFPPPCPPAPLPPPHPSSPTLEVTAMILIVSSGWFLFTCSNFTARGTKQGRELQGPAWPRDACGLRGFIIHSFSFQRGEGAWLLEPVPAVFGGKAGSQPGPAASLLQGYVETHATVCARTHSFPVHPTCIVLKCGREARTQREPALNTENPPWVQAMTVTALHHRVAPICHFIECVIV